MATVWKYRVVEPVTVFVSEKQTRGINGMVTLSEDQWKDWVVTETPTGGLEVTPPSKYSTLKIPAGNLFLVITRPDPEPVKAEKPAAKKPDAKA